ncbi:UNVERIFIED_CONTAM: hypothetical protein O8I53_09610 [Campylobacter lari]
MYEYFKAVELNAYLSANAVNLKPHTEAFDAVYKTGLEAINQVTFKTYFGTTEAGIDI